MKNVVVIGGGPVGLWAAALMSVETKGDVPDDDQAIQVTVIERRNAHTREQIVLLDAATVRRLPPTVKEEILANGACYIQAPVTHIDATCYRKPSDQRAGDDPIQRMSVPLKVLERALERYAKMVGVQIVRTGGQMPEITSNSVRVGKKHFPYDVLIGADGKNSTTRKYMKCREKPVHTKPLYAVIAILHDPRGRYKRTQDRAKWRGAGFDVGQAPNQESWRVFRTSDGRLLYVGLTVPPAVAKKIVKGDEALVAQSLESICKRSGTPCNAGDADFTVVELNPSQSDCFVKRIGDKMYFLIGDAAINTHFFTGSGLNRGFRTAERLAVVLPMFTDADADWIERNLRDSHYELYLRQHAWINAGEIAELVALYDASMIGCKAQDKRALIRKAREMGFENVEKLSKEELCFLIADRYLNFKETLDVMDAFYEHQPSPPKELREKLQPRFDFLLFE